jgi:hypothetical protein
MPFTLNITPEVLTHPKSVGGAIIPSEDDNYVMDKEHGFFALADDAVPDQFRFFSSTGSCGPSCRAYVTRVVCAKLAGTGLVAALAAQAQNVKRHYSWTCGLSAAVNLIACAHYVIIVLVRSQIFPKKYEIWSIQIDRNEQKRNNKEATEVAIYVQENIVDSLRFSDWVATLVLMTLALGADRDFLYAEASAPNPVWSISPWWLAALQVAMISCGSWWRFYVNEGRGESFYSKIGAAVFFTFGCFIFAFIVYGLLDGLWPVLSDSDPLLATDALVIHILVLVWCGYPLTYAWSYFVNWTNEVPLGSYSSRASTGKDLAFGALDVASKGGLAIYSAMRCLS